MFKLLSWLKRIVFYGPCRFVNQHIKLPLIKFIYDTVNLYKARTQSGVNTIREILFRGTVVALITALLVWLSIFMYIGFYYTYVPTISHERPVHLKFRACDSDLCGNNNGKGMCSFPSAHIKLTERQRLLMLGQSYKIHLHLEMPESPTNKDLGMFMVCADFLGHDGRKVIANSCRSTMLHYRGYLLDTLYKLVFSPFFVFGSSEEKQNIHLELFSDFEEIESEAVTDIFIEIQTTHVEIYSAKFLINAHFTGLRFLMYNWPVFSAALGITSNLVFIAVVCMISWYQIINSEEYHRLAETQNLRKKMRDDFDSGSSSSSLDEDASLLEDDKHLRFRKGRTESRDFIEEITDVDC